MTTHNEADRLAEQIKVLAIKYAQTAAGVLAGMCKKDKGTTAQAELWAAIGQLAALAKQQASGESRLRERIAELEELLKLAVDGLHAYQQQAGQEAPSEKINALRRALEIIAVGDAEHPQAQAAEELIALGYWLDAPEARVLAAPPPSAPPKPPPRHSPAAMRGQKLLPEGELP